MRFYPDSFRLSTPSDLEILVERDFDAPPYLVYEAFTKPELVRRWLLGPEGWSMPVCEIDLRVGGTYRYLWRKESTGEQMGMGGTFLEVDVPKKLVATERFDEAWYPGEAIDTTVFEERAGGTTRVRLTVLYQSKEARDMASRSGMDVGMAIGYSRMEEVLSGLAGLRLIEAPGIVDVPAQLAAAIHIVVPREDMPKVVGPGLGEIFSTLEAQRIAPAGRWFDHHLRITPESFDFELCVPVAQAVAASGRVVCRELSAMRAAQAVYKGAYEHLGPAWGEFDGWMKANSLVAGPDLFQVFEAGPESSADPAAWRTLLRRPLA